MLKANTKLAKWLMLLLNIMLCFALAISQPRCLNIETYENNSTYQANLNALISSLSPNIGSSGFYNASIGQSPDQINAIVLCRGDISLTACRECIDATAPALVQRCQNSKDAIFWNETCMIRYSNHPIFGKLQTLPVSPNPSSSRVMNPRDHSRELRALLESLKGVAANGGSFKKVAAGNRSTPDFQTIYALEQCTPDISAEDCTECLNEAIKDVPICCGGIIGAGILRPSCTLRFENYRFYSASIGEVTQEPLRQGKDDNTTTRTAIIVVVSVAVCVTLAVSVGVLLRKRMKQKLKQKLESELDEKEISTVEPIQYDFGKIRAATDDFSNTNKLGQGGFGAIYRGKLVNGRKIIVKRLSKDLGQSNLEFKNEVVLLANLRHRNLARLSGFCMEETEMEETERVLVYEFVRKGSLDEFISDPTKRFHLDGAKRCKIIEGIARGLLYLHEDSRVQIIQRDLKASDILLDGEMNPKILNFGVQKSFVGSETQGSENGTYEYAVHGKFLDVFSFGVLVLEIVSGQRNNQSKNGEHVQNLLSATWKNWCKGTAANMMDPALRANASSLRDILRYIHIGLLCIQENVATRPTMASIVLMLSYFSITLPAPSKPAFDG